MKSISTASMGSRLGKAKDIITQLSTYPDYAPVTEDLTIPALKKFIESIEKQNAHTAAKIQEYTIAIDARRKSFTKESGSLSKFVTQLSSLVRYSYGRDSNEAAAMHAMTLKIRGAGPRKKVGTPEPVATTPAPATKEGDAPEAPTKSRSERTFGNRIKIFDDIVATIVSFNATYKGTAEFSIAALKARSATLNDMNEKAVIAHSLLRQTRELRNELYAQLKDIMLRSKDAAKAHYGTSSSLYKLVKGAKV